MKQIKLFLAIALLTSFGVITTASAQTSKQTGSTVKTETLKVSGKCEMCKTRIEKAVKGEGATSASWDQKAQLLTVSFDPSKTNLDAIGKKLAAIGHDNEKFKATDEAYEKLPGCCHYDRVK
jgi:copper chaperone CopZ